MKYVLETARRSSLPHLDYRAELNAQQLAVVDAPFEELLVIAGAGTGKTRALTHRVARLIADGCAPERVCLVTFTNRAAREMIHRVESLTGASMKRCPAGTFHHVGHRLLRANAEAAGLDPDFAILDPEDVRDLISSVSAEVITSTGLSRALPSPKLIASVLSLAANTLQPVATVIETRFQRWLDVVPQLETIAQRFAERKRRLGLCDFDDLLLHWLALLQTPSRPSVRDELLSGFDHVLVDEFQDVNALQGALIDIMASKNRSLTCVGDDAQSIFGFRGADFAQIRDFRGRHPAAKVLTLAINYRSTPEILALANRSIAHNLEQHSKSLSAVRNPAAIPAAVAVRDVYQQAEFVAQRVLELHRENGIAFRDMAVLYRNHAHGLEIQVELTRRNIPYSVRSGVRFFEQAHVKDVLAFLRAHSHPSDPLAWGRCLRLWPGVGIQTAERLAYGFGDDSSESMPARLLGAAQTANGVIAESLAGIATVWEALDQVQGPCASLGVVLERFYRKYAESEFTNAETRIEDLEQLAAYAERWQTTAEFLAEISLIQGAGVESATGGEGEGPEDRMILSTIHQAKGLEWPVVFLVSLAEGRFPSVQASRSAHELEEERRLFYVATTRAADQLYLVRPIVEERPDGPTRLLRASRFVLELDRVPPVFDRWDIEEAPMGEDR